MMSLFLCRQHLSARSGLSCTTPPNSDEMSPLSEFTSSVDLPELSKFLGTPSVLFISLLALPSFSNTWIVWIYALPPSVNTYRAVVTFSLSSPSHRVQHKLQNLEWTRHVEGLCAHLHICGLICEMGQNYLSCRSSE